jgi:hypothetical protein
MGDIGEVTGPKRVYEPMPAEQPVPETLPEPSQEPVAVPA